MEPTPSDLARATSVAHLSGVMPYLEAEFARMEATLITRVFREMDDGELTPDKALWAWMELRAYRRAIKGLDTRVKVGQSVGERTTDYMNGGHNGES